MKGKFTRAANFQFDYVGNQGAAAVVDDRLFTEGKDQFTQ